MDIRKLVSEAIGTALLVFVGAGVATLCFGFKLTGSSTSAGVVETALAFGLVMLVLAYALGPISGAHINPAVTLGFLVSGRIAPIEAVGYWVAQIVGGIVGAAVLRGMFAGAGGYSTSKIGLGADGFGDASMVHLGAGGAFLAEAVLTFLFVLVVLVVTRTAAWPQLGGVAIGLALATVHLIGVPLTGTSVNPARSIGPAVFVGGDALSQLWLFILAPLVGGAVAALLSLFLYGRETMSAEEMAVEAPAVA
ncbi:aquaporin [Leekyejoonella antrihumi]|uniref:Aquaporin n=1 Tax=Leekyejoonella antrihumi TaxID=1660198 RepID=A0A563E338_9MICO|nr:aquaporin [Leekyejoonella antrihumi]TWP36663.1 aquaporin [Leekyejoonella antrihumi]